MFSSNSFNKIDPRTMHIGDYLWGIEGLSFEIPEFQRPYSRGITNCDKLWQDILDFAGEDRNENYFFGTIIVNYYSEKSVLSLIDGQQRTTTFYLFFKALLKRVNEILNDIVENTNNKSLIRGLIDNRKDLIQVIYRVERRYISDKPCKEEDDVLYEKFNHLINNSITEQKDFINDFFVLMKSKDDESLDDLLSSNKIFKRKYKQGDNRYTNFFKNYRFFYDKLKNINDINLNLYADTILKKCEVILINCVSQEQAISMFNSLNSDGLPLNDWDIISSKLYANAKIQGKLNDFISYWNEINNEINDTALIKEKNLIDADSLLTQYMYYIRAKNKEVLNKEGTGADIMTPGVRKYFININKTEINNPLNFCEKLSLLIKFYKEITKFNEVCILLKLNENVKLFLSGFLLRFKSVEELLNNLDSLFKIVKVLMKLFILLEVDDTFTYSSSLFKSFLFLESAKLVDPQIDVLIIEKDFNEHIKNKLLKENTFDIIKNSDRNGLVYLKEYLYSKDNDIEFTLYDKSIDIEHIMPNSGKNKLAIRIDAKIETEEEFEDIVNQLGNKILLEYNINRSIGNERFKLKVENTTEDRLGYKNSKFPFAQHLVEEFKDVINPKWRIEDIKKETLIDTKRILNYIIYE